MDDIDSSAFPANEWEWQTLERDLSHWIKTSGYRLNQVEQRPFRRIGLYSLTSGVSSGFLIHYLLKKLPNPPKRPILITASIFSGLYSSVLTIRLLRKSVFTQILEMKSPLGDTARQIVTNARKNQVPGLEATKSEFKGSVENVQKGPDYLKDPFDTGADSKLYSNLTESPETLNSGYFEANQGNRRSWDDIRKNNQ